MTHWTDTFTTQRSARRMHGRTDRAAGPTPANFAGTVVRVLNRAIDAFFVWQERSHSRYRLAQLDERMLRDIGINRVEALREASKPFWRP